MKTLVEWVSGKSCSTVKTRKAKDELRQREEKREKRREEKKSSSKKWTKCDQIRESLNYDVIRNIILLFNPEILKC